MRIRTVQWNNTSPAEKQSLLKRPAQSDDPEFTNQVGRIIEAVRKEGDSALLNFTRDFDKVFLSNLRVTPQEITDAYAQLPVSTLNAIKEAIRRVSLFHDAQLPTPIRMETSPGVLCERQFFPIDR